MSLEFILGLTGKDSQKIGLSEERIREALPELRKSVAFFREYPDMLVDFYAKGVKSWAGDEDAVEEKGTLTLFIYQRIFLRAVMRHKLAYAVFPRAFSKSFLSIMILMLRCILYPRSQLFITTGGKEQATSIAKAKVEEICELMPAIAKEIDFRRGKTIASKDMVRYIFKNGSVLDIMAARQSSRGQRRVGGLMEECVLIDGTMLNEIIIPTMNVDRLLPDGSRCPEETINKSQIYVTTAGYKNSFAYDKLKELLIRSVIYPDEAIVLGGTYKIPVMEGLLSKTFVSDLKADGTYNEDSFEREYCSRWSGDAENAFFNSETFDKYRVLNLPEKEYSARSSKTAYYILGVDVGRKGCTTEVCVIKVTPQNQGSSVKSLVNMFSFDEEHFETQAINIKRIFYRYKARRVVIDGNGLGIGLVDYMVKAQVDENTNEYFPSFGVENDSENFYKKFKAVDTEPDAMYIIKANAPINSEAHSYVQTQMSSGKLRFLKDERDAKVRLMDTKIGQKMTPEQRAEYLQPFTLTSILRDQMLNLVEENEGQNIILKQATRAIRKDKFSAYEYGLYYIKQEEDRKRSRRSRDMSKMMFFT